MVATTIKINNTKETALEFDVAIQGLNEATLPKSDVRFVVTNADGKYNLSVKCAKMEGNKWLAKIPALNLSAPNQNFRVEVIVDGYYFEPAAGTLVLISEPKVGMVENTVNPIEVKASFTTEEIDATEVKEDESIIDISSIAFDRDTKFGDDSRIFTATIKKVANILETAISKDGIVKDVNKPVLQKAIDVLETSITYFKTQLRKKKG